MKVKNDLWEVIQFKSVNVVGSSADKNLMYSLDIDLHDRVNGESIDDVRKTFIDKIEKLESMPDAWITDFKCGTFHDKVALKWSIEELKQGFKIYEDKMIQFRDALQQKSVIKLDVIALEDRKFTEITINYFFIYKSGTSTHIQENVQYSLYQSYVKNKLEENYYVALKRLYRWLVKNEEHQNVTKEIQAIFNSTIAKWNKALHDLELVHAVILNRKPVDQSDILYNLSIIEKQSMPQLKPYILDFYSKMKGNNNKGNIKFPVRLLKAMDRAKRELNKEFHKRLLMIEEKVSQ